MLARSTSQPKKHVVEDNERVGNWLAGRPNASLVVVDLHHSGVLASTVVPRTTKCACARARDADSAALRSSVATRPKVRRVSRLRCLLIEEEAAMGVLALHELLARWRGLALLLCFFFLPWEKSNRDERGREIRGAGVDRERYC
jgi:hypothetical protein